MARRFGILESLERCSWQREAASNHTLLLLREGADFPAEQHIRGLNENVSQWLGFFNTWSPVGGFWVGLGGMALPEEVCHCGEGSSVSKSHPLSSVFSACACSFREELQFSSCPHAFAPPSWILTLWKCKSKYTLFYNPPRSWHFITTTEK